MNGHKIVPLQLMRQRLSNSLLLRLCALLLFIEGGAFSCGAFSFALDSIAEMGRFPKFCVDTYRWGDKFFNGYDSLYVKGTGYKFNAKIRTESWLDYYRPKFDNGTEMSMVSDPSTSVGIYLTYLAVSVGYDINVSRYFTGEDKVRKRWDFQFNCMLFGAQFYYINNDVGTTITDLRPKDMPKYDTDYKFNGINTTEWGIDVSYFFNHKRYSQAAAFNLSRIQVKSGGSFFAGFSFSRQKFRFDFNGLPDEMKAYLPSGLEDSRYVVNSHNYLLSGGYGYNWVFAPKWLLGVSFSPMIGLSSGNNDESNESDTAFAFLGDTKLSVAFNHKQWFAGVMAMAHTTLVGDRNQSCLTNIMTLEVSAGIRFNLW